jgi:hypothetical protein
MTGLQGRYVDRSHPLMQGLVAWYDFSDGKYSRRLSDKSGNGYHGTLTNMVPADDWVGGPAGGALDFDGINDAVSLGANAVFAPPQLSVVAMARLNATPDLYDSLASYGSVDGWQVWHPTANADAILRLRIGATQGSSLPVPLTIGAWVVGVWTYDGGKFLSYANGLATGSAVSYSGGYNQALRTAYIGSGDAQRYGPHSIARFALYSSAISQCAAAELAARLLSGRIEDLYERTSPRVFEMIPSGGVTAKVPWHLFGRVA